MEDADIEF
jgi:Cft2 family RNA processing exonuclease